MTASLAPELNGERRDCSSAKALVDAKKSSRGAQMTGGDNGYEIANH